MSEFFPVHVYFVLVALVTLTTITASALFPSERSSRVKFQPYESGIQTETHLLQRRFPIRYYLIGLVFLIFDAEVVFLYPWAVVGKEIGPFAFYEMLFFMTALFIGFAYIWRKGGLQWE